MAFILNRNHSTIYKKSNIYGLYPWLHFECLGDLANAGAASHTHDRYDHFHSLRRFSGIDNDESFVRCI